MLCRLVDHSLAENVPASLASLMPPPARVPSPQPFVPTGFSLHLSRGPPAAGGVHRECSVLGREGGGGDTRPPRSAAPAPSLSGKKVSSTDKMLNDRSFAFCGTEIVKYFIPITCSFSGQPPHGRKGSPEKCLKGRRPQSARVPKPCIEAAPPGLPLRRRCLNAALCWAVAALATPRAERRGFASVNRTRRSQMTPHWRSNQPILKETNREYSLEEPMLKLKLQ